MTEFRTPDGLIDERMQDLADKIDKIHNILAGNGKVGFYERVRRLEFWGKVIGVATLILLILAVLEGKFEKLLNIVTKII